MIPYGRQDITQEDIDAVVAVLRSDYLTQGPVVPEFESAVARYTKAEYAVAANSATSALHAACMALELGPGDSLWTVPNTFVASANCGLYCGADVDFVDIDSNTWNMSTQKLRDKLVHAKKSGRLPKVVVPVHFSGQPTEQEEIWELAGEFGFRVIEDASHSIGASRNGESVGSCRWSDVCVFSFHPVKIITSGEGGIALTNEPALAHRMAMFRNQGTTKDPDILQYPSNAAPWYYEQQVLGYNYRMTDVLASLGLSQLKRIDARVSRRNELAIAYDTALMEMPIQLPTILPGNRSAFHLYTVRLPRDASSREYSRVFEGLRGAGVGVNLHYLPVHLQPYFRSLGFSPGQFEEAEVHGRTAITLPLFSSMTNKQLGDVVEALGDIL